MNCSINNHHVLARPSAHGETKQKQQSKKKEKKPKSPRSAYQLFFQHEKEKILGAGAGAGSSTAGSSSYSRRPRDGKNGEALLSEIIANKGKLCVGDDGVGCSGEDDVKAPLGEESVEERDEDDELSREISRRWKDLDESARAIYDGFSILERKRYERELAWRGRAGEEGDNAGLRTSKAKAGKKRPLSTIQRCPEKEDASHDLEPLQKKQKMRQRRRRSSRSSASEEEGASAVRAKKKKARAAAPKHKFLPAIGSCSIPKRAHPRRSGKPFRSQYVASSPERKMSPQPSEIQCSGPSAPLRTTTVVPSCDGSSVSSLSCCSAESPQPQVRRPLSPLSEAAEAVADSSLLATGLFDPRPIQDDAQPSPVPLLVRRAPPPPPPLGSGLLGPAISPPLPSVAELNQFQRASSGGHWRVGGVDPLLLQKQQQQEEERRMLADLYSPTPIGGGANEVTSVSSTGTANTNNGEESLDKESVGFLSSVFFAPVALIG